MQQQQHHHHHHKPKPALSGSLSWIRRSPPPSPPHKKPWGAGAGGRGRYACRLVPLLVLTLYSLFTVLRIPSSSLVVNTADSERVERRDDVEAFKTHLPSNQNGLQARQETRSPASLPCSAFISGEAGGGGESSSSEEGVLCCDRSHYRSDVCYLRGDARTDPSTSSILLYDAPRGAAPEKVRPYTRKFEDSIMRTIDEVTILPITSDDSANGTSDSSSGRNSLRRRCDVRHPPGVAAVVFSTGGYTGNVYHELSDGLIPLFVTSQRFQGQVVFVVLEYHYWWLGRYGAILERLTNYKIVDFRYDRRVHCFDEMIVGLRIHGELVVDPKLMPNGKGLQDFQALLHQGYSGGKPTSSSSSAPAALPLGLPSRPCDHAAAKAAKPKMLIFIRKQNRVILNLPHVVTACRRAGFAPHVMNLRRQTPLPIIHAALASADAMVAVHGAAVTHFLFMRPGTVLLQIVPVGLDWAAESFYGKPAQELGLKYMEYKVAPEESSLAAEYGVNSTVVRDPSVISSQGWWEMKKVYMDRQNVTVGVKRFGELLRTARLHLRNATACGKAAALR